MTEKAFEPISTQEGLDEGLIAEGGAQEAACRLLWGYSAWPNRRVFAWASGPEGSRIGSRMVSEIAGEDPTPLEVLLAEPIAGLWVLVELQEALNAAWYDRSTNTGDKTPARFVLQMVRLQEAANRRYLAAIKTLAQVRKPKGPARRGKVARPGAGMEVVQGSTNVAPGRLHPSRG